jgi:hypothetical protein
VSKPSVHKNLDDGVDIKLTKEQADSLLKAFGTVRECDVMDVMEEDEQALCWDLITELERVLK